MSRLKALKALDKIIGIPLMALLPRAGGCVIVPEKIKRALFIRPGGIGDLVLLLPAVRALAESLPGVDIDLLCEGRNAGVAKMSGDISGVFLYDNGPELLRCLRSGYDAVIDTEQWHRLSAAAAFFTGAPVRIGYATNNRKKLFTHPVPYSHDEYEVYSFFHLIEPLTGAAHSFDPDKPFLDVPEVIPERLSSELRNQRAGMVAIFPGATVRERRWGARKFGMAAKELENTGYKVVILGSAADKKDAEDIRKYSPGSADLTGKTTLEETARVLKACKALVTADSGLMHVAFAVGTPTVSLFGSGIEKKWAPPGKNHIVINKGLDCSPCTRYGYTPRCPRNVECLEAISPEEVLDALDGILTPA